MTVDGVYLTDNEYKEYQKLPGGRTKDTYIFDRKHGDNHKKALEDAKCKDVKQFIDDHFSKPVDVDTDPKVRKTLLEKTLDWISGRYPGEKLFDDILVKISDTIDRLKDMISRGIEWIGEKIEDFFDSLFS